MSSTYHLRCPRAEYHPIHPACRGSGKAQAQRRRTADRAATPLRLRCQNAKDPGTRSSHVSETIAYPFIVVSKHFVVYLIIWLLFVFSVVLDSYADVAHQTTADNQANGQLVGTDSQQSVMSALKEQELHSFNEAISKSTPFWQAVKKEERERWFKLVNHLSVDSQISGYKNRISALHKYVQQLPDVHWDVMRVPKGYSANSLIEKDSENRDVMTIAKIRNGDPNVFLDLDVITGQERAHVGRLPSVLLPRIQESGGSATVCGGVFLDDFSWYKGDYDIPEISFRIRRHGDSREEVFYPVYISDADDLLDGDDDEHTSAILIFHWVACNDSVIGFSPDDQVLVKIDDIRQIMQGGTLNSVFYLDQNDIENYKKKTELIVEEYDQAFSKRKAKALKELLHLNR
jgi:hypothetical protein